MKPYLPDVVEFKRETRTSEIKARTSMGYHVYACKVAMWKLKRWYRHTNFDAFCCVVRCVFFIICIKTHS